MVNNFIVYFNTAFYFIVTIFRTKDTILCLLNIQTQFLCTQPIVWPDVIQGSLLIYFFIFILVVLTGQEISNNDLYICIKLLYASFESIADNTEV